MTDEVSAQLTGEQMALLNSRRLCVVMVTVTRDGQPNAAPMALVAAPDPHRVLVSVSTLHETYQNVKETGKVALSVMASGDRAFTVKGPARVVQDTTRASDKMSVVEVEVREVKDDVSPVARVNSGVETVIRSEKARQFMDALWDELQGPGSGGAGMCEK